MGEAGRKLTIRMPDNPRLRTAEVGDIHIDPGLRVRVGAPVMTLVSRRREHMVRAPRPGRIVPLVAKGDQVSGGDPLYILNLDEAALAESNRDARALVAVDREKWTGAVGADPINPTVRQRPQSTDRLRLLAAQWAKPALAIALYVLACFALLPILNAFGRDASPGLLVAMAVGCIGFAFIIWHLYAPDTGRWPRWTVRLIAVSWVAISSFALLNRVETHEDITLTGATQPLVDVIWGDEEPLIASASEEPETPIPVVSSGVLAGLSERKPVPDYQQPRSVRFEIYDAPRDHGVIVRIWGRVDPDRNSGDPLNAITLDGAFPGASELVAIYLRRETADLNKAAPLPSGIPQAGENRIELAAIEAPAIAALAELKPEVALGAANSNLTVVSEVTVAMIAELAVVRQLGVEISEAAPSLDLSNKSWVSVQPIPVLQGEGRQSKVAEVLTFERSPMSRAPVLAVVPKEILQAGNPDPILLSVLRPGEDAWMLDQSDRISTLDKAGLPATVGRSEANHKTVRLATLSSDAELIRATLQPARYGSSSAVYSLVVLKGDPRPLPVMGGDLVIGTSLRDHEVGGEPTVLQAALRPSSIPSLPPEQPEPSPEMAERLMLFIFFDDPRIEKQPKVGDEWYAQMSPNLKLAVRESRVEKVHEIVQVAEWCTAKEATTADSDDSGVAWLNDRIRLLQVRIRVEPDKVNSLESELPIFSGSPGGFFHNGLPLIGGPVDKPLIEFGRAFLRDIPGGGFFDDDASLLAALAQRGCKSVEWNDGAGPVNEMGFRLSQKLDG